MIFFLIFKLGKITEFVLRFSAKNTFPILPLKVIFLVSDLNLDSFSLLLFRNEALLIDTWVKFGVVYLINLFFFFHADRRRCRDFECETGENSGRKDKRKQGREGILITFWFRKLLI